MTNTIILNHTIVRESQFSIAVRSIAVPTQQRDLIVESLTGKDKISGWFLFILKLILFYSRI